MSIPGGQFGESRKKSRGLHQGQGKTQAVAGNSYHGNILLTPVCHHAGMEEHTGPCEHRWRYFVHVASRSVRVRECERCGRRSVIPTQLAPLEGSRAARERLTA